MKKSNGDIRKLIFENDLRMYQVAERVGVQAPTLCRWMQTELTPERKKRVQGAINELLGVKK